MSRAPGEDREREREDSSKHNGRIRPLQETGTLSITNASRAQPRPVPASCRTHRAHGVTLGSDLLELLRAAHYLATLGPELVDRLQVRVHRLHPRLRRRDRVLQLLLPPIFFYFLRSQRHEPRPSLATQALRLLELPLEPLLLV